jgi:hypothetical protein
MLPACVNGDEYECNEHKCKMVPLVLAEHLCNTHVRNVEVLNHEDNYQREERKKEEKTNRRRPSPRDNHSALRQKKTTMQKKETHHVQSTRSFKEVKPGVSSGYDLGNNK